MNITSITGKYCELAIVGTYIIINNNEENFIYVDFRYKDALAYLNIHFSDKNVNNAKKWLTWNSKLIAKLVKEENDNGAQLKLF